MNSDQLRTPVSNEIRMVRVFAAPPEVIFKAWTDPEIMVEWMGPKGFRCVPDKLELRIGGAHRACLIAPNGENHWVAGRYLEINPPSRLRFTHHWEQSDGGISPETIVTVDLVALGGSTEMTFHQGPFSSDASRDGHTDGWNQTFERLALLLKHQVEEGR
ncbi:SRPBCC family protein [Rhizobium sp. BR 315]|uniref:SRPBCC family protein n=1 Tax=Rhizobium sp. BR 315 TaxID=3040014 RepID=UPI003D33EAB3